MDSMTKSRKATNRVFLVILIVLAIVSLFPVIWVALSSFKPQNELFSSPMTFFPKTWTLGNYISAISQGNFARYFMNTVFVACVSTVLTVLINIMAGYALAKYYFRGRNLIFGLMIATLMVPLQVIMIPIFLQLKNLGIEVTTESAGWDTAYDRAQSTPLVWGWGAHSPMELYNMYHTDENSDLGYARYSPYANETVDGYMDMAMAATDTDEAAELWKKAQWDGETGVNQDGDVPWVWLCNVDHLYYVRDGVDIGEQKIHPHGHGWSLLNNVDKWSIE